MAMVAMPFPIPILAIINDNGAEDDRLEQRLDQRDEVVRQWLQLDTEVGQEIFMVAFLLLSALWQRNKGLLIRKLGH
jgi:hypothetical protein